MDKRRKDLDFEVDDLINLREDVSRRIKDSEFKELKLKYMGLCLIIGQQVKSV